MRKSIMIMFSMLLSFGIFSQVTPGGTPVNTVTITTTGTGKNVVTKQESTSTKNQFQVGAVQGTKSASSASVTTGSTSYSRMDAGNSTPQELGTAQVFPTQIILDVEATDALKIGSARIGVDSITFKSLNDNNADETLLKIKPISLEQIVKKGDGTQKARVFVDWTKSETVIKSGLDSTFQTISLENIQNTTKSFGIEIIDPVYYNSIIFGKGPSGEPINEINMGESAGTKSASQHWGDVLIAYDVADGDNQSRVDLESTSFKATSTDGTTTTTQTITPAIYEVVADSPGSSEQGIIYADATLINTYVADTQFSGGETISKDKVEVIVTEVSSGNTTTVTTAPTESKSVNTQGSSIGTVRTGAESSYLKNEDDNSNSGVYVSSENTLIESADAVSGNSSSVNFGYDLVSLGVTDGANASAISILPLGINTETGSINNYTPGSSTEVTQNQDGTKYEVYASGGVKTSTVTVAVDSVRQVVTGTSNQKSIQKSDATKWTSTVSNNIASNTIVQDVANTTMTSETIYLFAGASGIESSGASIAMTSPNVTVDGNLAPRNVVINAGTTSQVPLRFSTGTNATTPVNGAMEYDGSNYFVTAGGVRYTLAKTLTATASLNFPSTSENESSDLTINVTGAADGDAVSLGVPIASQLTNIVYTAFVSAPGVVTVRLTNNENLNSKDPEVGTFRVSVTKY